MASFFIKTPTQSHPFLKTHHNSNTLSFPSISSLSCSANKPTTVRRTSVICYGMIEPDGGRLVELVVPESERDVKKREAMGLPKVKLSRIDLEWLHVLNVGLASPLTGFMRESEFLHTLHFNSLRLGAGPSSTCS